MSSRHRLVPVLGAIALGLFLLNAYVAFGHLYAAQAESRFVVVDVDAFSEVEFGARQLVIAGDEQAALPEGKADEVIRRLRKVREKLRSLRGELCEQTHERSELTFEFDHEATMHPHANIVVIK